MLVSIGVDTAENQLRPRCTESDRRLDTARRSAPIQPASHASQPACQAVLRVFARDCFYLPDRRLCCRRRKGAQWAWYGQRRGVSCFFLRRMRVSVAGALLQSNDTKGSLSTLIDYWQNRQSTSKRAETKCTKTKTREQHPSAKFGDHTTTFLRG